MSLELYLVGVGHYDREGPKRLQKLLQSISPNIVSIEYNPQTISSLDQFEKAKRAKKRRHDLIRKWSKINDYDPAILQQVIPIINFEYFVAKEYCRQHDKSLLLSDQGDPDLSQRHLHHALSTPAHIIQQQIETAYCREILAVPSEETTNLMKRDAYTETILRVLRGKVAHIAGAWHVFGDYHNLYERVKDLNPIRIMLQKADLIE